MSRDVDMGGPLEGNLKFWSGFGESMIRLYIWHQWKKLNEEVIVFYYVSDSSTYYIILFTAAYIDEKKKGNSRHIKKILKQFWRGFWKFDFFSTVTYQNEIPRKTSAMDNDFYHGNECFLPKLSCAIFVRWRLYTRKYYRVWNIASYTGTKEPVSEKLSGTS